MKRKNYWPVLLLAGAAFIISSCGKEDEVKDFIGFEELELDPSRGYWIGEDSKADGFTSGNASFPVYRDDTWGPYWEGFAYTSHSDTRTPGPGNQFSSYAGGGAEGSEKYAVFFKGFYGTDTLQFLNPELLERMSVSNTTYAALAMRDGDEFTKKFGGGDGSDPDWFSLTIQGISPEGNITGTIEVAMADYRDAGTGKDYISNAWTTIPMESLGIVEKLVFGFASSDTAYGFVNVPTYICIDNIVGTLK